MDLKNVNYLLIAFATLGTIVGYALIYPQNIGICSEGVNCLSNFMVFSIGKPLFFGSPAILLVSIIINFINKEILLSCIKFSVVTIPIFVILIAVTPQFGVGDYLPGGLDKTMTTLLFAVIYLIGSFLIILIKSLKLRKLQNPQRI
jgi:hypothetical protein